MKILKFNEASTVPLYAKGQILVFAKRDIDFSTALAISKKIGYPILSPKKVAQTDQNFTSSVSYAKNSFFEDEHCFLVNTPVGKEDMVGKLFVEDYPEFFDGYERRDLNLENIFEEVDDIMTMVDGLQDFVKLKSVDEGINSAIDEIIKRLKKLKV